MHIAHEKRLEFLGKTLNVDLSLTPARAQAAPHVMFSLVSQVARLFRFTASEAGSSPANVLMESAGSRAGLDAHHARELRAAASAWLSVVR